MFEIRYKFIDMYTSKRKKMRVISNEGMDKNFNFTYLTFFYSEYELWYIPFEISNIKNINWFGIILDEIH